MTDHNSPGPSASPAPNLSHSLVQHSINDTPLSEGTLTPSTESVKGSWKRENRRKSPVSAEPGTVSEGVG